ncbi:MAG: O-antigen ligase family protein [Clostridiales bacterium]|nr:O-antigen ligase family protein [Clostridiales bacterium]
MVEKTNTLSSVAKNIFSGTVFKVSYLVLALLSFNAYVFYLPAMKLFAWGVAIFGSANLIYRLINYKDYIKTPGLIFTTLFLASGLLTFMINIGYNTYESAQGLTWTTLQLLMLYVISNEQSVKEIEKEIKILAVVFIAYTSIICMFGLYTVVTNYNEKIQIAGKTIVRGFSGGRLWGMYTDPNYGAVSTVISFILSLHLYQTVKKIFLKIILISSLGLSFIYVVFSASRTGYICMMVAIVVYAILVSLKTDDSKKKRLKRILSAILVAIFVSTVLLVGILITKGAYFKIADFKVTHDNSLGQEYEQQEGKNSLRDMFPEGKDLSNGRIKIWKSAISFFKSSPVFGIDFRNIQAAAPDKAPELFGPQGKQIRFDAFHNILIDILVSQGLVGLIIFLAFTVFVIIVFVRFYSNLNFEDTQSKRLFALIVSVLSGCLVSAMFLSDVLYVNTQNTVMFWIMLGYGMKMFSDDRKKGGLFEKERLK